MTKRRMRSNERELSHRWLRGRVACMKKSLATQSVEHKASRHSLHRLVRPWRGETHMHPRDAVKRSHSSEVCIQALDLINA